MRGRSKQTSVCYKNYKLHKFLQLYLDDGGVAGDGHSGQPSGVVVGKQSSDLVIAQ